MPTYAVSDSVIKAFADAGMCLDWDLTNIADPAAAALFSEILNLINIQLPAAVDNALPAAESLTGVDNIRGDGIWTQRGGAVPAGVGGGAQGDNVLGHISTAVVGLTVAPTEPTVGGPGHNDYVADVMIDAVKHAHKVVKAELPSNFSGYSGRSGRSGYSGYPGYSGYSGYPGYSGYSGYPGYSGYSGYPGYSGYSGYSGKSAILRFADGVNRALFCTEAPMAIFDDIMELTVIADQNYAWLSIDPLFIEACESDTIVPTGIVAETPVMGLAASVSAGTVRVDLAEHTTEDVKIHVRLTGKRRGMTCRFPARSDEMMLRNNAFWAQAHHT